MQYSIEIGKIIEGALKHDRSKVINYTEQLIQKLEQNDDHRSAEKFKKLLSGQNLSTMSAMDVFTSDSAPVDSESRMVLADLVYPDENTSRVILSKRNEEDIKTFILNYKNADRLNSLGIKISNTLLLYGPPGCGKTQSAYLIARELSLPLVVARLDSLISSFLGTTSKNIRSLFDYAQKMPCVLFLDEFDAIAKARDDSNELGELKRVVNSLLQNVDALSSDSLLIAATNHDCLLDSAVWRRFDYKIKIDYPDKKAIVQLIDLFTQSTFSFTNKEKEDLALLFEGLSGAEIEEIITKAIRNSVVHSKELTLGAFYTEFFSYKSLLPQEYSGERQLQQIKAKYLRNCSEKAFSMQTIADILGCSKSMVSTLLKTEGEDNE